MLRSRLSMLSAAAAAFRHAQTRLRFSCIMCVDVAGVQLMEAAAVRCRTGAALFPELRCVCCAALTGCQLDQEQLELIVAVF